MQGTKQKKLDQFSFADKKKNKKNKQIAVIITFQF
jgi:hypothetical protein